jgi:DNA-binding response OmpR family regulator
MSNVPRILIVDDDEHIRQMFSRVLTVEGYDVRLAATAQVALELVAETHPDAILLDLQMPFISGTGFLYRLRADAACRRIPVGIITGTRFDDETLEELRSLNAKVWQKPLSMSDLLMVVRSLLARGQAAVA